MAAFQSLQPAGGRDESTREGKVLAVSDVGVALDGGRVESLLQWATPLLQALAGAEFGELVELDDAEFTEVPALVAAAVTARVTDGSVGATPDDASRAISNRHR